MPDVLPNTINSHHQQNNDSAEVQSTVLHALRQPCKKYGTHKKGGQPDSCGHIASRKAGLTQVSRYSIYVWQLHWLVEVKPCHGLYRVHTCKRCRQELHTTTQLPGQHVMTG